MERTEALLRLVRDAPASHLVIGGSSGTPYETCVSDLDAFLIADDDLIANAARTFVTSRSRRPIDLERMTRSRFDALAQMVRGYSPTLTAGFSPFSFSDLRFLARSRLGQPIITNPEVDETLAAVQGQLRVAAAFYLSSMFIMRYQDAFGLLRAKRFDDLGLLAGELTQLACSVALLQTGLTDLSPKLAPRRAVDSGLGPLPRLAGRLIRRACVADLDAPGSWAEDLLRSLNAVVSAGVLNGRGRRAGECSVPCIWSPEQCVMGVPGYLTVMDVLTDRVWIVNEEYLLGLVASQLID